MPTLFRPNRGTIVASSLLAAGATGTIVDPNGPVGITLFGVAVAAAAYLVARPFQKALRRRAPASRPDRVARRTVVWIARPRTVATVAAAAGVLFTLWLATDLSRPLVYACWWGFCLLATWLVTLLALTAHRSLRTAG
jgi:hypothetical protein